MSRLGSFKLKLVAWFALLALLPLIAAFYGYDTLARQSETRRADAGLEAGLRAAVAGYTQRLDAATAQARLLARSPDVQNAFRAHDAAALDRLLPDVPAPPAATRTVEVVDGGRVIGRVTVGVRIDDRLIASLAGGLAPGDRLVATRAGRVIAGPGRGASLLLEPGAAGRVRLDGRDYRGHVTATLGDPAGLRFAALSPQSRIDAARRAADKRVAAALAGSLILFAIATYLLGRSVVRTLGRLAGAADAIAGGRFRERVETHGTDEFAQVGRAFNRMASQLEQRLAELDEERERVRDATTRFGEALAATHDPGQLVRIVVESAVEATGAAGGLVTSSRGELARAGDPEAGTEHIALPLRVGSSDFGSLVLSSDGGFEREQIETATSLAAQVCIALENARLHRVVERQALVDVLTGLANRRSLEETLRAELARAVRFGDTACLVMADLDDFKQINDRYGHAAGDEVLKEFAATLRETVRESDVAGRWGGEEFALVLAGTDATGGARLAERARAVIASRTIQVDREQIAVTASFGVAAYPAAGDPDTLMAAADAALYEAKRLGKNRVVVASESTVKKIV